MCVFEECTTLDLLSGGRAEMIAGRGAFVVSFAPFGFDLDCFVGSLIEQLLYLHEVLGPRHLIGQIDIGSLPFARTTKPQEGHHARSHHVWPQGRAL